ncbi:MAG: hypothetical protein GY705_00560, partial [Bacteroidetes bacterium]|nr:hypothetical protein [Bacteroidota bacterium]
MYRFTTHPHSRNLQKEDFQLFASLFKECINKKIPGSSKILFISELSQLKREYADLVIASSLRKNLDKAFHGGKGIYKGEQDLIIPFSVEGGQVAALFQSVDSFFLKQADHGWLEGVKNELLSEFTLIKQANIDSKTGLPNLDHLFHVLHSYEQSENLYIMLMEIASKGRGINKYLHHNRVTVSLK